MEETADPPLFLSSKARRRWNRKKQAKKWHRTLQKETIPIPYSKGDIIYLENGTPFLIEEITDYRVTLRDPSLLYPILKGGKQESFLQLLGSYPQAEIRGKGENFRITDEDLGQGSKREKFVGNINAITTLQTIERKIVLQQKKNKKSYLVM